MRSFTNLEASLINVPLISTAVVMAFFRQYIAPLLIVLVFLVSLVAVSIRSFLPSDMAGPAPVEEVRPANEAAQAEATDTVADLPPALSTLIRGLPDDLALSGQL